MFGTPDNMDRASWAATAIEAFTAECRMDGEDDQTKAKDLITNLCHFLRLNVGMTAEEAASVATMAISMFEQEVAEDDDDSDDVASTTDQIAARIKELEEERDGWVIGAPDGTETPAPEAWAEENPEDAEELARLQRGHDHEHPVSDWQEEVANGDTKLGYAEWCANQN